MQLTLTRNTWIQDY